MELFSWIQQLIGQLEGKAIIGHMIGSIATMLFTFGVAWIMYRRALRRFYTGESSDVVVQAHYLLGAPDDPRGCVLTFRSAAPKTTVELLFDNPAARRLLQQLIAKTTMRSPVIPTTDVGGFELLNALVNYATGMLATSPFPREEWLLVATCEDRAFVQRHCVRVFLIRRRDLEYFADWAWCMSNLKVEKWYHYFRVVALHQIALEWRAQNERATSARPNDKMPLVNDSAGHDHIIPLSLGINPNEVAIGSPIVPDWQTLLPLIAKQGLVLPTVAPTPAPPV